MTEGLEGTVPTKRGVVAGTKNWKGAVGQVRQEMLGTNTTGLFNLRHDLRHQDALRRAKRGERSRKP